MRNIFLKIMVLVVLVAPLPSSAFSLGAWVAYWSSPEGVGFATEKMEFFSEVSPLVFEVGSDFSIVDEGITKPEWQGFFAKAKEKNIPLTPTILWGNKDQIHAMLSNKTARTAHINAIIEEVKKLDVQGIDIDYEAKYKNDKPLFSQFITELATRMHAENKILTCTIEARTLDTPRATAPEKTLMAWANNYRILGAQCDFVRVMAYDHYYLTRGENTWKQTTKNLAGLHADYQWTKAVTEYALKYIPKNKLIIALPTYGYEFEYKDTKYGRSFTRIRTLSYERALEVAGEQNKKLLRFAGGEQYFTYLKNGVRRVVVIEDSQIIAKKIAYLKMRGIAGAYLFKVEGTEDQGIFVEAGNR